MVTRWLLPFQASRPCATGMKEKRKRAKCLSPTVALGFWLARENLPWDFCLHLIGLNWGTQPSLALRDLEKFSSFYSRSQDLLVRKTGLMHFGWAPSSVSSRCLICQSPISRSSGLLSTLLHSALYSRDWSLWLHSIRRCSFLMAGSLDAHPKMGIGVHTMHQEGALRTNQRGCEGGR